VIVDMINNRYIHLVNGIAKPGQLVAIMGASGAGKTTLMNILTHRRPGTLKISGDVRVNGTNMGRNINRVAGYVQQEELFVPSMTTREHLYFHVLEMFMMRYEYHCIEYFHAFVG
jgi:ABC-type multidrug transport system ATPase subunit